MSEYYYRLCSGLNDIGSFHPVNLSPHKAADSLDKDLYKSLFLYTKSQVDAASEVIRVRNKKTKKVYDRPKGVGFQRDVEGNEYPEMDDLVGNKLIFDFDAKDHELARKDALTLVDRLSVDLPIDDIQIYFSGGKGFHVEVELQEFLKNTEIRSICMSYIEGLPTSDGSVYNSSRIFRLAITKHNKSGMYKVPLYLDDLKTMSMEEIHNHAGTKFSPDDIEGAWGTVKVNDKLLKRKSYMEIVKKKEPSDKPKVAETLSPDFETVKGEIAKLDFSGKPAYLSATKFVLHKGLIPQGVGQEARMILCSTYKAAGYDAEYAYRMLKSVSEARVKRFGDEYAFDTDELWNSVVLNVFDNSWQGGTYGPTNPLIQKIDNILPVYLKSDRYNTNLLTDLSGSANRFRKYARDIDKNTIKSGIKSLDDELRIQTGQVLGLIGSPGSGKTSLALTILNNTDKLGEQSIFFSLDMCEQDVYQKLIQRHTARNSADIYDVYKKEDTEQIEKFERMLEKNYTNVSFCFKPTLDIDQMEKAIIERTEETGKEVKFIIVDYLDLIRTQANDPTQSSMQAIQGLRGLAQNLNVAVIVLLQPNKAGSKLNEPMMTYNSIKGSSAVAEVASAIISVHRPGAGLGDDNADRYFTINCLKNRNGRMFNLDFHWKGITGTIRELEHVEKMDLKGLREAKKEDKDNEERKGNSW